jgi:hypothetical protein
MPKVDGQFIPHGHCNVASGDCFVYGRCLGNCTARQKKDHEQRIKTLEDDIVSLRQEIYRLRSNNKIGGE